MKLISTADYCDPAATCPYANAFWNGTQMAYGDGFAQADDVVGHELTHGVTDHESRLFYYYQSGAINESLSDVWGEFVDLSNTTGTDTATTRWQMGEDVPGFGAIRDMEDPTLFGDPDRMRSPNYYGGEDDGGGVHYNSGVNNKAAFLMTDGGSFNGRTVTPSAAPPSTASGRSPRSTTRPRPTCSPRPATTGTCTPCSSRPARTWPAPPASRPQIAPRSRTP